MKDSREGSRRKSEKDKIKSSISKFFCACSLPNAEKIVIKSKKNLLHLFQDMASLASASRSVEKQAVKMANEGIWGALRDRRFVCRMHRGGCSTANRASCCHSVNIP